MENEIQRQYREWTETRLVEWKKQKAELEQSLADGMPKELLQSRLAAVTEKISVAEAIHEKMIQLHSLTYASNGIGSTGAATGALPGIRQDG